MNENEKNCKLALDLLRGDTEDDVIRILQQAGYWDDPSVWREYGDRSGNFSTIGNQQSRPEAALVEKLINSVDSRLINECLTRGVDSTSEEAPSSIRVAVARFFEDKEIDSESGGTIRTWTQTKRTEEAKNITLSATGSRRNPSLTISDLGEGQTPNLIPYTFLSIDRENKLRIPFVQGKFNMGGTGALKFCGRHRFQLVITKRNPEIIKDSDTSDDSATLWGFTIVRRELPSKQAGSVRNSVYKYLAPVYLGNGEQGVLRFEADSLPLMPEHNEAYKKDVKYGSALKLYNYDMKGFTSHILMKGGLLNRLEILLPNIALPIRLHECRDFKGKTEASFSTNLSGLTARLEDGRGDNLEDNFPCSVPFQVEGHDMVANIYAFQKGKAESYRTNEGIIFSINGQTHGTIPKSIFGRNRVKMHRLADSLLVMVDCSKISVDAREDLFMNSRDRLSDGHLRKAIERQMEDILATHPALRELRESRRQKEIANRLEDSKPLEDVLNSILKSSPTLASLFLKGQRLSNPFKKRGGQQGEQSGSKPGEKPYDGKPHPTFFKFHNKEYGEQLVRKAEVGRKCRIKFDTDVVNDYFERASMPGRYQVTATTGESDDIDIINSNLILHNGYGNWSIEIPDDVKIGQKIALQCQVSDDVNTDGFINYLTLEVAPKSNSSNGSGNRKNRNDGGDKDGKEDPFGIQLPDIKKVKEPDWENEGFNEFSATKVIADVETHDGKETTIYTFCINVDNKYLKTEMKDSKDDASLVEAKFVYGNVLIGLALLRDSRAKADNSESDLDEGSLESNNSEQSVYTSIEKTSKALAPFLIPMIDSLGGLSDSDVASLGEIGDQD